MTQLVCIGPKNANIQEAVVTDNDVSICDVRMGGGLKGNPSLLHEMQMKLSKNQKSCGCDISRLPKVKPPLADATDANRI